MKKEDWYNLFNPEIFIQRMIEDEEISQEEILDNNPYGVLVTNLCHNSCAWMYLITKKERKDLLPYLFLVSGSIRRDSLFYGRGFDHSWVEYRKDKEILVLDLTLVQFNMLAQFRMTEEKLYIGERLKEYNESISVCFNDEKEMMNLILSL